MREYIDEAFVLGTKPQGETDLTADIFLKNFGRLEVKVIAGRKVSSKLSPHLDSLNLINIRLIQKSGFTLTDVLVQNRFSVLRQNFNLFTKSLEMLFLIKSLLPLYTSDQHLWYFLRRALEEKKFNHSALLKIFGYDPKNANCDICHSKNVSSFSVKEQVFLCFRCSRLKNQSASIII